MSKVNNYVIGVDLGGTTVKFGLLDFRGNIKEKLILDTNAADGPDAVIKQILKGIKQIVKDKKNAIVGVGIGAPGIISIKKGTVENPPNFPGWEKVHLGKIVEKKSGYKTFVENDANAAAIGELIFGAGKKLDSFIMVTLGTGVGGGIILNKKLYRGEEGGAGEIGHVSIDYNGKNCNCGSKGCIESYIGINYLVADVKELLKEAEESKIIELVNGDLEALTPKIISEAALSGDQFSIEVVNQIGERLGSALTSVCNLLDIGVIILGGGLSGFGDKLFNKIECTIKSKVVKPLAPRIKVVEGKLKNDAGIQGASALAFYKLSK